MTINLVKKYTIIINDNYYILSIIYYICFILYMHIVSSIYYIIKIYIFFFNLPPFIYINVIFLLFLFSDVIYYGRLMYSLVLIFVPKRHKFYVMYD